VVDHGVWREDTLPAERLETPREVDILTVHEQPLIEDESVMLAYVFESAAPVECRASAGTEDFLLAVILTKIVQPDATIPRHPAD
jgi:hypothetical protein